MPIEARATFASPGMEGRMVGFSTNSVMRASISTPMTPKPSGILQGDLDAAHRQIGALLDVIGKHRAVVHLVDVVAGQDQHMGGVVHADDVEVLEHRVRGAHIPGQFIDALLGGQQFDEFAHRHPGVAPAELYVADQGMGLVLGEYTHAPNA